MKVISYKILRKSIELLRPIPVGKNLIKDRKIAILTLETDTNIELQGEISPLPGLNYEGLDQSIKHIEKLLSNIIPFCTNNLEIDQYLFGLSNFQISDSAQFAFESALLNLKAPNKLQSVTINELIPIKDLVNLKNINGSIKIKVNGESFHDHALKVNQFISNNPNSFVRLDGNCSFSVEQLKEFCILVDLDKVEYFEEPLSDYKLLSEVSNIDKLNLALDENILSFTPNSTNKIVALIIKPQLHGISQSINLISLALNNSLTPVISSCFEGSVGMKSLIQLINLPQHSILLRLPHGLGTYKYLKEIDPPTEIIYNKSDILVK